MYVRDAVEDSAFQTYVVVLVRDAVVDQRFHGQVVAMHFGADWSTRIPYGQSTIWREVSLRRGLPFLGLLYPLPVDQHVYLPL